MNTSKSNEKTASALTKGEYVWIESLGGWKLVLDAVTDDAGEWTFVYTSTGNARLYANRTVTTL